MRVCIFSKEAAFAQKEGSGGGAEESRWPCRTAGGGGWGKAAGPGDERENQKGMQP